MLQVPSSVLLSEYQKYTRDTTAANIATGKQRINYYYIQLMSLANNYVVERTKYGNIKSGQRSYLLSPDYIKMKTVRFYDGTRWYRLEEVRDLDKWEEYTSIDQSVTIPSRWTVINEQGNMHLEIDDIPNADRTKALEVVYEGYQDPLSFPADVTAGTVTIDATNTPGTVTGSGTAFDASMVGRFFTVSGGKYGYDIKAVADTTHLSLVNFFQEGSQTGVSFTIAECLRLPPEFSYTPVYAAVRDYYLPLNFYKGSDWDTRWKTDVAGIINKYKSKTKGRVTPGRSVAHQIPAAPRNYPLSDLTRIR